MIWWQGAACFLVWILYGWALRRRSEALRRRLEGMPRSLRVLKGSLSLIGSVLVLGAGLAGLAAVGGLADGRLTLWAWPLVALLGLAFIHGQVTGAAALITLVLDRETPPSGRSSLDRITNRGETS